MDNWIRSYPAKTVTIHDIPRFAAEAHNKAFTPENIISGFSCTGIFPYNDEPFPETEFAASNALALAIDLTSGDRIVRLFRSLNESQKCWPAFLFISY